MAIPVNRKWIMVNNEGEEVSEDEPSTASSEYVTLEQDGACSYHHEKKDASDNNDLFSSLINNERNLPVLGELLSDSISSMSGDTLSSIPGDTSSISSEVAFSESKSSSDCDSVDRTSTVSSFLDVSSSRLDTPTTFDSESNSELSEARADAQDLFEEGAAGGSPHYHLSLPATHQSKLVLVLRPRRQLSSGSSDSDSDFVRLDNSSGDDASDSEMQSSNTSQHTESDAHHENQEHLPLLLPAHREVDAAMPVLPHFQFFGHRDADFEDNDDLDGDDETESVAEDDRIESDQSDMAPAEDDDDSIDLSYANIGLNEIDLPTGPVVRQYVHRPNNDLNITLDHVVGMVVILVVGIAIGHGIGWSLEFSYEKELLQHELAVTKQQRDDLMMDLKGVRAKLLHEETERERTNSHNRLAGLMKDSSLRGCNKELYSVGLQLGIHTINDPYEDCDGCPLNVEVSNYSEGFRVVKDELNKLQVENADLRSVIGQMRYAQHPGNHPEVDNTATRKTGAKASGPKLRTSEADADHEDIDSDAANVCVDLTADLTALNRTVLALRQELNWEYDRVYFWQHLYSEHSSELDDLRRLNATINAKNNKSYHDCLAFLNITLSETMTQSQALADNMKRMILNAWNETSTLATSNIDIETVKKVIGNIVTNAGETAGNYFKSYDSCKEDSNMDDKTTHDGGRGRDDSGSGGSGSSGSGFSSWIPSFESKSAEPDENNNYGDSSRSVWSESVKNFLNHTRESMTKVSKQIQEKWHQLRNLSDEIMESKTMSTFQEKVSEKIRHVKDNVNENLEYIREKIRDIRGKHKKNKFKDAGYHSWPGKNDEDFNKKQFEGELTDIIKVHFNKLQGEIQRLDKASLKVMNDKQFGYLIEDIDDLKDDMEKFFGRQRGKEFAQTWLYCQKNWLKHKKKRQDGRVSPDCQWAMFDWQLAPVNNNGRSKHMCKKGDKKFADNDDDKNKERKQYSRFKPHCKCKSKGDCQKIEAREKHEKRQSHHDKDMKRGRYQNHRHANHAKQARCHKNRDDHHRHGDKAQYNDKTGNYHGKYAEKLNDGAASNHVPKISEPGGSSRHHYETKDKKTLVEDEVTVNLSEDHLEKIGSWYFRGMTWRDSSGRHPGDHSWFLRHMKERSKYHTLSEYMLDEKPNWLFERAHGRQFRRAYSNSGVFGRDD